VLICCFIFWLNQFRILWKILYTQEAFRGGGCQYWLTLTAFSEAKIECFWPRFEDAISIKQGGSFTIHFNSVFMTILQVDFRPTSIIHWSMVLLFYWIKWLLHKLWGRCGRLSLLEGSFLSYLDSIAIDWGTLDFSMTLLAAILHISITIWHLVHIIVVILWKFEWFISILILELVKSNKDPFLWLSTRSRSLWRMHNLIFCLINDHRITLVLEIIFYSGSLGSSLLFLLIFCKLMVFFGLRLE